MRVIGNGFIAKNLKKAKLKFKDDYIIYAAGISNSKTKNKDNLKRERTKFIKFIKNLNSSKILIYISSLSVVDKSLKKDNYIQNKLFIENFLKLNRKKFIIVRLTQVVGFNKNPNTLTNFFFNNIKNKKEFIFWTNTKRNLIDIKDVQNIFRKIVKKKFIRNKIINIQNPVSINTKKIIDIFSKILKQKPNFKKLFNKRNSNHLYTSKNNSNEFSNFFKKINYNEKLLIKYYK